jgi:hypothetical protein
VVRLYAPDGSVRVIDFAQEDRNAAAALRDVERATQARDRALRQATERWHATIVRAVELGQAVEDVAAAAGLTVRELRAVLRGSERER